MRLDGLWEEHILPLKANEVDLGSLSRPFRNVIARDLVGLNSLTVPSLSVVNGGIVSIVNAGAVIAGNFISASTTTPALKAESAGHYALQAFNITDLGSDLANASAIGIVGQSVYANAMYAQQGAVSGPGSILSRNNVYSALYVTRVVANLNGFNYTVPLLRIDDTTTSTGGLMDVKRGANTVFAMANTGAIVANATAGIGLTVDRGIQLNASVNATAAGPSIAVSSNTFRLAGGTSGIIFVSQDNGTQLGAISNAGLWQLGAPGSTANANAGDVVIGNNSNYKGANNAGNNTRKIIRINTSDQIEIAADGDDIRWGRALIALGGGAVPTLGTIGGSGPATAAQNSWMRVIDSGGAAFWVPVWK